MVKLVLVVEDEPYVREMTVDVFEEAGMRVLTSETADQALTILESCSAELDLLFTDVQMPGEMNGLDLARTTIARWPHIKVIVTSATLMFAAETMPSGAGFIPKPWREADVLRLIARVFAPPES